MPRPGPDEFITGDVQDHLSASIGNRLGGKGARKGLAALARAGRKRRSDSTHQLDQEEEKMMESNNTNELKVAIMFHLLPVDNGPMIIDTELFCVNENTKNVSQCAWTAPGSNGKYSVVCVWFSDHQVAKDTWSRYSVKNLGIYRKCYHLGNAFYIHAVSQEEHPVMVSDHPFKNMASSLNARSNMLSTPGQNMDFASVIDALGEQIVQVEMVFAALTKSQGIHDEATLRLALKKLGISTNILSATYPLDLCHFCRLVLEYSTTDTEKVAEIRAAFEAAKLFPSDEGIDIYDIANVTKDIGLSVDDATIIGLASSINSRELTWAEFYHLFLPKLYSNIVS